MSKQGMGPQEPPAGSLAARLAQARVERQRENERRAQELLAGSFLIGFERVARGDAAADTDSTAPPAPRAVVEEPADGRFALAEIADDDTEPAGPANAALGMDESSATAEAGAQSSSAAEPNRRLLSARFSTRRDTDEPTPWVTAATLPTEPTSGWMILPGGAETESVEAGTDSAGEAAPAGLPATALPITPTVMPGEAGEQTQIEVETLRAQLQQVQEELRAVRRRGEKDKDDLSRFVGEVVLRIIPVMDDLDRALAHVPPALDADPWVKGVLMIGQGLHAALEQQGVERVAPCSGEPFDPRQHEAVAQVPADNIPEDTITEVYRPGYSLHGRMLRPAQVEVAVRKDL